MTIQSANESQAVRSRLCSPQQIRNEYGFKTKTLAVLRCSGEGAPFLKIGRSVFYDRIDFEAWLQSRKVSSTSQQPGGAK